MSKPIPFFLICLLAIGSANAQPSGGENAYAEGIKLKNAEKYSEALTAFKGVLAKNPGNTDALYEAGWISNELKAYDNAITYLLEAKQLNSTPNIFFELGYAYENSGKKDEAKESYKKALELYPKHYDAAKHLG